MENIYISKEIELFNMYMIPYNIKTINNSKIFKLRVKKITIYATM